MDYYVSYVSTIVIRPERQEAALAAILAAARDFECDPNGWRRSPLFDIRKQLEAGKGYTLEEVIGLWGWNVSQEPDGLTIEWDHDKSWNEEEVLPLLAPFVEADAVIEAEGEEGDRWRWVFDGTSAESQWGATVYLTERRDALCDAWAKAKAALPNDPDAVRVLESIFSQVA